MENNIVKFEGTVKALIFKSATNDYVVFSLSTKDEDITVVGELGNVRKGQRIIVEGTYSIHPKFGKQFKATSWKKMPIEYSDNISTKDLITYGFIQALGQVTTRKIVGTFGVDFINILNDHPERLIEVKEITSRKAKTIMEEYQRVIEIKELDKYLAKFDMDSTISIRLYDKYGHDVRKRFFSNPYILCSDDIGLPIRTVDPIAIDLGIEYNSYDRILAGSEEVLNVAIFDGQTCLPMQKFSEQVCRILMINGNDFKTVLEKILENKELYLYKDLNNELFIYKKRYYLAEIYIARKIYTMVENGTTETTDHTSLIESFEKEADIIYNEEQRQAINMALNSSFMILTGGPGTGKTTTLNAIINIFKKQNLNLKIAAPTGRAAKKISEVTGYDAVTIHRLLEVNILPDGTQTFLRDEDTPLDCDVLIIDETSMVDSLLMESLLKAVRNSCKVILVGDSNQLPSVSAGNVLKELITSEKLDTVVLKKVLRQAQRSTIVMNAHKILDGNYPDITRKDNDFFFLQRLTPLAVEDTILELWSKRLPKAYGVEPIESIQILTPSRKGVLGTVNLNKVMQDLINPHVDGQNELKNTQYTFRIGDKVMQTKNNYRAVWEKEGVVGIGIFNGDIGTIIKIINNKLIVSFDGKLVRYDRSSIEQLELAYAITIHKSQGSEFEMVIMPMLDNYNMLSYRNLLYTGVTRAKKLMVIVGSTRELYRMVDNNRQILRYTCLKDMIIRYFDYIK